jgi:putative copper resistance protein D
LKIALFAGMVCLAGINREYLLPRLLGDDGKNQTPGTLGSLLRNALIEIALGFGVILIVGMIGIMMPATGMDGHLH